MPKGNWDKVQIEKELKDLSGTRYEVKSIIGAGSYGVVLEAIDTQTNEKCAIKRVSPEIFKDSLLARRILREIKLLAHFSHDNIIGLQNMLLPKNENFDIIFIVMDVMETDLKAILKSGQKLTDQHVQYFIQQILKGLDCIHRADVIHRDLTPSNVLLNTNCDLKICDFGLAKEATGDELELTDYVVMRWYRAPELVMEDKHYTGAVDVWACGCIMAEMFHKNQPLFRGKDRINQLDVILQLVGTPTEEDCCIGSSAAQKYLKRRPKYSSIFEQPGLLHDKFLTPDKNPLTEDAIDLLKKMLQFNPSKRISVQDALKHPYLADLYDEEEPVPNPSKFRFNGTDLKTVEQIKKEIYNTIKLIQQKRVANNIPASDFANPQSPTSSTRAVAGSMQFSEAGDAEEEKVEAKANISPPSPTSRGKLASPIEGLSTEQVKTALLKGNEQDVFAPHDEEWLGSSK